MQFNPYHSSNTNKPIIINNYNQKRKRKENRLLYLLIKAL